MIAHPIAIDIRVITWFQTEDFVIANANTNVASSRTSLTHGIRERHIPHTRLEAEIAAGERTDGTNIYHVHRHIVIEAFFRIRNNSYMIAAINEGENGLLGDLIGKTNAARARNATLGIEKELAAQARRASLCELFPP